MFYLLLQEHFIFQNLLISSLNFRVDFQFVLSWIILQRTDFIRILKEPKNALTKQYLALFEAEGVEVIFTDEAIDEIANTAFTINAEIENIGARRLHTVMSKLLNEFLFDVPDKIPQDTTIEVNAEMVKEKLSGLD